MQRKCCRGLGGLSSSPHCPSQLRLPRPWPVLRCRGCGLHRSAPLAQAFSAAPGPGSTVRSCPSVLAPQGGLSLLGEWEPSSGVSAFRLFEGAAPRSVRCGGQRSWHCWQQPRPGHCSCIYFPAPPLSLPDPVPVLTSPTRHLHPRACYRRCFEKSPKTRRHVSWELKDGGQSVCGVCVGRGASCPAGGRGGWGDMEAGQVAQEMDQPLQDTRGGPSLVAHVTGDSLLSPAPAAGEKQGPLSPSKAGPYALDLTFS